MRQTLIVSSRGQITLPAEVRKQFGIKSGEPVIIEERNGELVLKPATVLEVEIYSPKQIAEWDRDDQLDEAERKRIVARLPKVKARVQRN
ncbi:MAG: AbrB/MazE/SpoVT family DNA-binding domain-containing protein [Pseudomonadota bacterium]